MDQLPFPVRNDPLELAPRYRELQRTRPLSRVRTRAGDVAWLACGYDVVKRLAEVPALGRSHPAPERAAKMSASAIQGGPTGDHDTEQESHRRMRRLLTPAFSAKRMNALRGRIGERVEAILDGLRTPPVDLHAVLSMPLPVMVICELLGAPYQDYPLFRDWSDRMAAFTDAASSHAAQREFREYTADLLEAKRRDPGEDVFSDLANAADGRALPVDESANLAAGLLFAGHETTMTRIDLGTLLFLRNPRQREALRADPALVRGAVDEILRMSTGGGRGNGGVVRYAASDIGVDSTTIGTGDAVLLAYGAANRDPAAFDRPDEFDITRAPNPHLGFGHGPHFCIGNSLARIELHEVFGRLFQRFPTLRLAVPDDELPVNTDKLTGGLAALPVTW